tara:strand:+ start:148 stop:600 length:453 start_codon:yes stop_codon:yes gene_type:complete
MGATGPSSGGSGGPPERKSIVHRAATAIGNYIKGGGLIGMGLTAIGKANKKSRQNRMDYEGQAAGITPEGSVRGPSNNNQGGNDEPIVAKNIGGKIIKSPTTAEVSQSSATDAAAYDNRKTKAKGRSMTILRRNVADSKLTLGKKSLLGA